MAQTTSTLIEAHLEIGTVNTRHQGTDLQETAA